ncbi:MAG: 3-hydroxyacyl-CoA dehydrogenase [Advenella sp.]|uniref:3-hydroxyacyl-CoA dehydrogenase n=1 Tax=Advenella sp. S44 TaxID=1982755 RepID=UPI001F5B46A9|nr:3-hydroxyacyl-CoA dehydrogenase [Advenella sp. S44]
MNATFLPSVSIIGTGLIGQAWAVVFARAGCATTIWDGNADAARQAVALIDQQMQTLAHYGLVDDVPGAMARIQVADSLEAAVAQADYVQENLPEVLEIKLDVFARLDAAAPPQAILASSTSGFPASAFTEGLPGRERCLVAHPVNPPSLIPVVELCGARWTSEQTLKRARDIMNVVKQKPVTVRAEIDGFILNRLQGALLREAFRLVEQGYVSVQDLDTTVSDGLGLRWSFMGPFETIDLNAPQGISDYAHRYGPLYQALAKTQVDTGAWSGELIDSVTTARRADLPESELAARRAWRDQRLMALAAHKRQHANNNTQDKDKEKDKN